MTVAEVFDGVALRAPLPPDLAASTVTGIEYDSRRITAGKLFFAFEGQHADGRRFAADAIRLGALAVVSQPPRPDGFSGAWVEVEHGRRAMAVAARNFYGKPDERIRMTGTTGTNGKTTTCYLVDSVLRAAGETTALIGTIEYHLGSRVLPAVNTTPESLDLMRILTELESIQGRYATMEVSSHALALGRVYGLWFHTAIFTNLTRDHLDFHSTMEDYFAAKRLLFEGAGAPPPKFAVLNRDDGYGGQIRQSDKTEVLWYGLGPDAEVRATGVSSTIGGLRFDVEHGAARIPIESALTGRINVYNILAACSAGLSFGLSPETIARGIASCRAVPGRFERVDQGQPFAVVVDYAHTDDALRNTLATARELTAGRVITLFGCGGDRDRSKRPLMGQAAAEKSDFVVLTSDNPRSEDPLAIMNDALVGLRRYDTPHLIEPDRGTAIQRAIEQAQPGDVVILAGKGHENYQVLKDRTIPFDDREVARKMLTSFGYRK
ncbi:MAG TPA: UDP-N-acetylmuramoyl-L-alanyl-D-glutamate--2,6-diaminopimelate ligase [Bryobacteraceae bacterium]|jgi:UDP-N-acetylmuramoyl-L-alanyl-D-glutamate--2,6-diaminopimelate ligase|nr:UDP-N-acetylmuramoyl-L-alanyl-D-glutamate--2,6-diaminopimelate ligase [Bryobacteraceae bacterium]